MYRRKNISNLSISNKISKENKKIANTISNKISKENKKIANTISINKKKHILYLYSMYRALDEKRMNKTSRAIRRKIRRLGSSVVALAKGGY